MAVGGVVVSGPTPSQNRLLDDGIRRHREAKATADVQRCREYNEYGEPLDDFTARDIAGMLWCVATRLFWGTVVFALITFWLCWAAGQVQT
jgi:hypothetical protein